jgi:hypothetical protein
LRITYKQRLEQGLLLWHTLRLDKLNLERNNFVFMDNSALRQQELGNLYSAKHKELRVTQKEMALKYLHISFYQLRE